MKTIPGFPGYLVCEKGRVYSTKYSLHPRRMHMTKSRDGYVRVMLCCKGQKKTMQVHRLVLLTYCGEPSDSKQVACHLNGIRDDNRLANLRWGSRSENEGDKTSHPWYKLSPDQVDQIRLEASLGKSVKDLARLFKVSSRLIYYILRGEKRTLNGL